MDAILEDTKAKTPPVAPTSTELSIVVDSEGDLLVMVEFDKGKRKLVVIIIIIIITVRFCSKQVVCMAY